MELGRPDPGKFPQGDEQHPLPSQRRLKPSEMAAHGHHHQPPPPQKCPRCDSSNTKFCYYNNYSLSQPRYFCKACRRYWTQGGTLRNVPVGGGCRKSKRPKQSTASSSSASSDIIARTQPLPPPVPNSQILTDNMISSQSLIRAFPPPAMGNSFYSGGGVLSSLGALQSLPAGIINHGVATNPSSSGAYGANMALLHGISLPPLKPATAHQLQPPNEFFQFQQSLNFPPRLPLNSPWTNQSFNSRDQTSPSTVSLNFWSGSSTADGDNQVGSSLSRWSDKLPGFDPSQ